MEVIEEIRKLLEAYPTLRVGQLLRGALSTFEGTKYYDPYYVTDELLLAALKNYWTVIR